MKCIYVYTVKINQGHTLVKTDSM